jgi:sn-glycerol 3-phosphate transport system substrate-binding protein
MSFEEEWNNVRASFSPGRISRIVTAVVMCTVLLSSSVFAARPRASTVNLTMYFPIGVAGPLNSLMTRLVADFNATHADIHVNPVFAGDYVSASAKAQAGISAGSPPDVAVLLAADLFSFTDEHAVLPLEKYFTKKELADYWPAFLANGKLHGHIYSIPFQRSTPVLYYNKAMFKQAHIKKAPATWKQLVADAKKLTVRDSSGNVTRYGVEFPSDGTVYWMWEGLVLETGQKLFNAQGTKVYFNSPGAIRATNFLIDLAQKYHVMAPGVLPWGGAPTDFIGEKSAMIYHSTGSLAAILAGAKFPVGVAFMPKDKTYGAPTGGGSMYVFKGIPASHVKASITFIKWMTSPVRAAQWSIETGYVAVRKSAFKTHAMKVWAKQNPQVLVARDQLKYAHAELATHQDQQIHKFIDDELDAAISGQTSTKTALQGAQQQSNQILSQFGK